MHRSDLADLAAFVAVAEERSFTRAAARLGLSQSALSHAMRRVEERVGVRLLTRTTRAVSLTEAGEKLLVSLQPALDAIDAGVEEAAALRDKPSGSLRITASEHAAKTLLWPALARLLPDYPDIRVEICIDNGFVDIVEQRFDAGVRLGEAIAKDMIAVRIGPELRMACVAAPDFIKTHRAPRIPQELAGRPCINLRLLSSGALYAWEFEKDGRALNVRVEGQLTFAGSALVLAAAKAGFGFAFLPHDMAQPWIEEGKLVQVLQDWCPPFPGYHLYYPSRRQNAPAFALLVEALRYRG